MKKLFNQIFIGLLIVIANTIGLYAQIPLPNPPVTMQQPPAKIQPPTELRTTNPTKNEPLQSNPEQVQSVKVSQYPLPLGVNAIYAPQRTSAIALTKVFGMTGNVSLTLQQKDGVNRLTILTSNPNAKKDQGYKYLSVLDNNASIIREQTLRVSLNEELFKNASENEKTKSDLEKEIFVRIDNQPFLGEVKVITVIPNIKVRNKKQEKHNSEKEWLVDPEDPVVSLSQMIVWISTIRYIPPEGTLVRLVVDEQPLPVIVKMQQSDKHIVFTAYAAPNLKISGDPNDYMFKFVYPIQRINESRFMFPHQVLLNVGGNVFILNQVR